MPLSQHLKRRLRDYLIYIVISLGVVGICSYLAIVDADKTKGAFWFLGPFSALFICGIFVEQNRIFYRRTWFWAMTAGLAGCHWILISFLTAKGTRSLGIGLTLILVGEGGALQKLTKTLQGIKK